MTNDKGNWRVIDTGILSAAENITLDEVLLKEKNEMQTTLRFLRFSPPAVLIGCNQSVEREVRIDYCLKNKIDINRRLTGGGAIFFDETQIGWEVIGNRDNPIFPYSIVSLYEKISNCVVLALKKLGVNASFRPRNDIEVFERKISGTGGTEYDGRFLFQGTLLVDFDVETMMKALKIPIEKLKKREIESAKERVISLKEVLGYIPSYQLLKETIISGFNEGLNVELKEETLTNQEIELFNKKLNKFSSNKWIYKTTSIKTDKDVLNSSLKAEGGLLYAALIVNPTATWIEDIIITGDFFSHPIGIIQNLHSLLREQELNINSVEKKIRDFYKNKEFTLIGVSENDIIKLIRGALKKASYQQLGFSLLEANKIYEINNGMELLINKKTRPILLLPYCAKDIDCELRYEKDCDTCGKCDVGTLCQFAESKKVATETICSFDDLMRTLKKIKEGGYVAFIGCCCEEFYCRHHHEIEAFGVSGILIDIDSETCYELDKAREAYWGKFESQTKLRVELVRKIINKVVSERGV